MANRDFTKVSPNIWRSRRFRSLDSDARLCHFYFLTSVHQNSSGCFRLPDTYAAEDLGWDVEKYVTARDQVVESGLVQRDASTAEVYVLGWFRFAPPMNDKHNIGVKKQIASIESDVLRELVEDEFVPVDRSRRPLVR